MADLKTMLQNYGFTDLAEQVEGDAGATKADPGVGVAPEKPLSYKKENGKRKDEQPSLEQALNRAGLTSFDKKDTTDVPTLDENGNMIINRSLTYIGPKNQPIINNDWLSHKAKQSIALGEGILNVGTATASTMWAGLAGSINAWGYSGLNVLRSLGLRDDPYTNEADVLVDTFNAEVNRFVYEPRTEMGRYVAGQMMAPFEALAHGGEALGDLVFEKTGSPVAATAARVTPDALVMTFGLRGAKKAKEAGSPRRSPHSDKAPEAAEYTTGPDLSGATDTIQAPKSNAAVQDTLSQLREIDKQIGMTQSALNMKQNQAPGMQATMDIVLKDLRTRKRELTAKLNDAKASAYVEDSISKIKELAQKRADEFGTRVELEYKALMQEQYGNQAGGASKYSFYDEYKTAKDTGGEYLGALDITVDELVPRLIKYNENEAGTVFPTRTQKDIGPVKRWAKELQPGKFAAESNDFLKWFVDRGNKYRINSERRVDQILNAPKDVAKLSDHELAVAHSSLGAKLSIAKRGQAASFDGALTIFKTLKRKRQEKILAIMEEAEMSSVAGSAVKSMSKEYLASKGLNELEVKAVRSMYTGLEFVRKLYNETVRNYYPHLKEIPRMKHWLPHMFLGDFRVWGYDPRVGANIIAMPAKTKLQALSLQKRLQKEFPDLRFNTAAKKSVEGSDVAVEAFREALKYLEDGTEVKAGIKQAYERMLSEKGFSIHSRERLNIGGASGLGLEAQMKAGDPLYRQGAEFTKAYETYVNGGVRAVEQMRYKHDANKVWNHPDLPDKYPNSAKYARTYEENLLGKRSSVAEAINDALREGLGEGRIEGWIGKINYFTLMTGLPTVKFLYAQALQPAMVVAAGMKGVAVDAGTMRGSVWTSMLKGYGKYFRPDAEAKAALKVAYENRTIEPKFIQEAVQHEGIAKFGGFNRDPVSAMKAGAERATFMTAMASVEEMSRGISFLGWYDFIKKNRTGRSVESIAKDAAYLTDKYMVEYNNLERPLMFGSRRLGSVGNSVALYKTFMMNYLAQGTSHLGRIGRDPKNIKAYMPAAHWIAGQTLVAGVSGVIGVQLADNLIAKINEVFGTTYRTPSDLMITHNLPDPVIFGPAGGGIGLDITSTTSAPSLQASDFFSMPGLETAYEVSSNGLTYAVKSAMGKATDADSMQFWKSLAPNYLRGWIESYYTYKMHGSNLGGPVPDPKKGMRGTITRDKWDWLAKKYLGAYSVKESRERMQYFNQLRVEREMSNKIDGLVTTTALAVMQGQPYPEWLIPAIQQTDGLDGARFLSLVERRLEAMNTTLTERMLRQKNQLKIYLRDQRHMYDALDQK